MSNDRKLSGPAAPAAAKRAALAGSIDSTRLRPSCSNEASPMIAGRARSNSTRVPAPCRSCVTPLTGPPPRARAPGTASAMSTAIWRLADRISPLASATGPSKRMTIRPSCTATLRIIVAAQAGALVNHPAIRANSVSTRRPCRDRRTRVQRKAIHNPSGDSERDRHGAVVTHRVPTGGCPARLIRNSARFCRPIRQVPASCGSRRPMLPTDCTRASPVNTDRRCAGSRAVLARS